MSTVNPIEVILRPKSAVRQNHFVNGVNHSNLTKIAFSDKKITNAFSLLINARSMRSNGNTIRYQIEDKKPEIVAITETWNTGDDGDFFRKPGAIPYAIPEMPYLKTLFKFSAIT